MNLLNLIQLPRKRFYLIFLCSFFISINSNAEPDHGPIKNSEDLRVALTALAGKYNVLPISLRHTLSKNQQRKYGNFTLTYKTEDYHVGHLKSPTLQTLRNWKVTSKSWLNLARSTYSKMQYRKLDNKHYYTLEFKVNNPRIQKFTIVLEPKRHNSEYFEERFTGNYKDSVLWPMLSSTAWARDPLDRSMPIAGRDSLIGIYDAGLTSNHKLGRRYVGGYDFVEDLPMGPEKNARPGHPLSTIWTQNLKSHGDGVTHVAAGPEGLAFEANVYAARYVSGQVFGRLGQIAEHLVLQNTRVVNFSLCNHNSAWYIQNGRIARRGDFASTLQFDVNTLCDNGIASVIIAGNQASPQGPGCPGALASDHAGYKNRVLCVGAYTDQKNGNQEHLGRSNWAGPIKAMQERFVVAPSKSGATSPAAPLVSAAYAMLFQLDSTLKAEEATLILCQTARPIGDPKRYGSGLIDLDAATGFVIENRLRDDRNYARRMGKGTHIAARVYNAAPQEPKKAKGKSKPKKKKSGSKSKKAKGKSKPKKKKSGSKPKKTKGKSKPKN